MKFLHALRQRDVEAAAEIRDLRLPGLILLLGGTGALLRRRRSGCAARGKSAGFSRLRPGSSPGRSSASVRRASFVRLPIRDFAALWPPRSGVKQRLQPRSLAFGRRQATPADWRALSSRSHLLPFSKAHSSCVNSLIWLFRRFQHLVTTPDFAAQDILAGSEDREHEHGRDQERRAAHRRNSASTPPFGGGGCGQEP